MAAGQTAKDQLKKNKLKKDVPKHSYKLKIDFPTGLYSREIINYKKRNYKMPVVLLPCL